MTVEPTTSAIHLIVTAISTATLALLGVDYYALLWGLIGALFASGQSERLGRTKAIFVVGLSTLIGAAIGNGLVAFTETASPRPFIVLGSLVAGFGAQALLTTAVKALVVRIERVLGGQDGTQR